MNFSDEINQAIKDAMRAKDKVRLSTLRDIKSKIMVEATSGSGNDVGDDVVLKICMKLFKQRKETYELYTQQDRPDLAKEELDQAKIIEEFLPKMLSEEEIRIEVKSTIETIGSSGPQDMGKCMGILSKKLAGKADGKIISAIVRDELFKL
tara:strand:+ start:1498 stop:1950 length:453 start_codon:yes stop_codon:yes gene_type:complete